MILTLKVNETQAQALELAINAAINTGNLGADIDNELLVTRDQIERIISLQNLAARNMGRK